MVRWTPAVWAISATVCSLFPSGPVAWYMRGTVAALAALSLGRRPPELAKIGYARVSTRGQNDDSQVDDLTAYGCDKIFTNKVSGKLAARPELDKALAYLRQGDVFVITRLSRAMRSLKHLLALADELRERGVGLVVLKQQIDTTTPTGRLTFHILGAIDEFQRELIVEGTREGLDAARARGRSPGPGPPGARHVRPAGPELPAPVPGCEVDPGRRWRRTILGLPQETPDRSPVKPDSERGRGLCCWLSRGVTVPGWH